MITYFYQSKTDFDTRPMDTQFVHPETDFIEDAFNTVMLKREVMADILIAWRMKEMEVRYERYERQMRSWYNHEDDWPMFDMSFDYLY